MANDNGSYRILIIEDEKDIVDIYKTILEEEGFKVVTALDGDEGVEKATTEHWDLMLLDIMLPKKDGLKVLEEVREKIDLGDRKVVMLTNLGRESVIKDGFDLGAHGYLIKSELNPDDVVREVKGFLNII